MTPEQEIIRAGQAHELLNSPLFKDAKAMIEDSLAQQRRKVGIRDDDMHTRLILTEQLWMNLQDFFLQIAQTGQLAQFEIERQKRRINPFRR